MYCYDTKYTVMINIINRKCIIPVRIYHFMIALQNYQSNNMAFKHHTFHMIS